MNLYKIFGILRYPASNKTTLFTSNFAFGLGPATLHVAWWAFVLLYALSLCGSDLHTFSMVPPLTNITANPEFIRIVISATGPTKGFAMLVFILLVTFICKFWVAVAFDLPVTWPLHIEEHTSIHIAATWQDMKPLIHSHTVFVHRAQWHDETNNVIKVFLKCSPTILWSNFHDHIHK